jgi:hypothetical protein
VDISHFPRRDKYSSTKSDSLPLNFIKEVLRKRVFFVRRNNDKFDLIEALQPFLLRQDLKFELME